MSNTVHAVGRRKTSVARVYVKPGQGKIVINKREIDQYYIRATSKMIINQPLELTGNEGKMDILVNVTGGGLTGQAGAIRHAISRALAELDPENRKVLKANGLITRDARKKERKLYGQKGARARFQFSKR
ncbi:30S ribosomal protein S9 [Pseudobacteriovorax antillogorgiicola]|uniref:Small ribosomal subunit protein uS9 n=1 Tax=Pseudobacteriovorax antillogorgiicola TaxID=1513793 RepID=A0A1Y6B400_9BACT|nr:30S ribosomal protein S9 [Pseudobacteriovorax antillogorgiicola]TCS59452.1 SSU ribosomal protein S9P [Pseudobacteriovorax antillogorgiicola]SME88203.1 SSU ribosomal protein S9P [Pseudobacteriovorax antillogorgiicola]